MAALVLEKKTIKLIEKGKFTKFQEWCRQEQEKDPLFNIRDARDGTEETLKISLIQKNMTALNYAAYYGQIEFVRFLLEEMKADPTRVNVERSNALHCAVSGDNKDAVIKPIVEELMKNEAMKRKVNDFTIDPEDGTEEDTAFMLAVYLDLPTTVEYLYDYADPYPPIDVSRRRNIFGLAACNDGTVLKILLDKGKRNPEQLKNQISMQFEAGKYTPLHVAVLYLKDECVRLLAEAGADTKAVDVAGSCPIHYAIEARSKEEFASMIWSLRESIDQQDPNGHTILHLTVMIGRMKLVKVLMRGISDPNDPESKKKVKADISLKDKAGKYPIHHLCAHSGNEELVNFLTNRYVLVEKDCTGYNPLHLAVKRGDAKLARFLLRAEARALVPTDTVGRVSKDENPKQYGRHIIHLAVLLKKDRDGDFKSLLTTFSNNMDPRDFEELINTGDLVKGETPLYLAVKKGYYERAKCLLDKGAKPNIPANDGGNALHAAFMHDAEPELVKILLERGPKCTDYIENGRHTAGVCENRECLKEVKDNKGRIPVQCMTEKTPLGSVQVLGEVLPHREEETDGLSRRRKRKKQLLEPLDIAIKYERLDIVQELLERGVDLDIENLHDAVSSGNEKLTSRLVKYSHNIVTVLEKEEPDSNHTTNFNQIVMKMPSVAKEALDRCVTVNPDSVEFDYSFVDREPNQYAPNPMRLMVNHKHTSLLQHSVIRSYLYIQWNHLGFWYFMVFTSLYGLFLLFLSLFSLVVNHPLSQTCTNSTVTAVCELDTRRIFSYIFAGLVYFFGLVLVVNEVFRLVYYCKRGNLEGEFSKYDYFKSFQNWNELFLLPLSLIFVFNFTSDCGCPTAWQWQVGIFAVFLAWMNLLYIGAEFPKTGTYIIVFKEILVTFLKLTSFSLILVIGFALILLMMFSDPNSQVSSFSHFGFSLMRTMTMVTGELEFNGLFHFDVPPSEYTPIPFHIASFIMWVIFLVLIPIVLTNMLTSLAVGDTNEVIAKADLQKLTLQVETVLKSRANTMKRVKNFLLNDAFNLPGKKMKFKFDDFKKMFSWTSLQLFIWGGKEFVTEHRKVQEEEEDDQQGTQQAILTQLSRTSTV